ncbi:hypothetical protein FHETE_9021 [Fusarium heterosporum]|uniref:Rhodopsin domain-containing protein n=1 Tax=Fusarium heterosporum TaxID=42747 RepID=A0A8H5SUL1_FUSHE|nr:hypothetical protein FHETE_9021 [Fusarium heterosporum]
MLDENARRVLLDGLPLAITIIVSIFLGLAIIAVTIRLTVRLSDGTFGADDWLILAGTLTYIADSALAVYGASVGIGSKDKDTNPWLAMEGQKIFIIWITVYVVAVALIKSSVCVTLGRIADTAAPILRYAIWVLFGITWASCIATFFGILAFCRPIHAFWDPTLVRQGKATCGGGEALIGLSHTNTATSIITDVGCVVVPGFLLWKTQMSIMSKMQVLCLLSLASVASIATVVRAPFISSFRHPEDNLKYHIGYIVLFSCVEIGVEVFSIDGFQGRETDIMVFGTVRRNDHHEIGFLKDMRRMNVALICAKLALTVVGNRATLTQGIGDDESSMV